MNQTGYCTVEIVNDGRHSQHHEEQREPHVRIQPRFFWREEFPGLVDFHRGHDQEVEGTQDPAGEVENYLDVVFEEIADDKQKGEEDACDQDGGF